MSSSATAAVAAVGLSEKDVLRRRAEFGTNVVSEQESPRWRGFPAKFWSPVPWMLEAAILLQLGLGEHVEAAIVGALLLFNAVLGFIQEGRAGAALAALKKRLAPTALVRRDSQWIRLPAAELVPGDAIRLPLGAIVPADALAASDSLLVDPGGRIAIIDFRLDSPEGPPQAARIAPGRVIAELKSAGFALAKEHRFLPNQYFLVFRPA
jgi:magnesium-transporting ATPase (P-type)